MSIGINSHLVVAADVGADGWLLAGSSLLALLAG